MQRLFAPSRAAVQAQPSGGAAADDDHRDEPAIDLVAGGTVMTDEAESTEEREWRETRRKFYALVDHCIPRFQHVEDYLEDVFAAV